jgi:hypothetical protein
MKQLLCAFILYVSFSLSSCSLGLVATHAEPPFICFKKKCREMAKISGKSSGNKQSYQKSKLISSRKKRKSHSGNKGKKVKKHSGPSF